jgi:predicted ATPase/DNA-binding SARP family transcriptional activator
MAHLKLFVLGPLRLEREGQPVEFNLRKALALLAYLAVSGQPHSRDALATLLWPESDGREARARLRRTLHRLSLAIGEDILDSGPETIRLRSHAGLWLDCAAFRQHVSAGLVAIAQDWAASERLAHLDAAVELYTDDFLAGFTLPDSPAFDEWQFFQRESLRQLYGQMLEQLVHAYRGQRAWDRAIEYARRWLALDQLHEPAHRLLMRLYAWAGQHAAALRQYQECSRVLEAELGAAPEDETTTLYEAIRTRQLAAPEAVDHQPTTPPGRENTPAESQPYQQYLLEEHLADGGQGEVFRGRDRATGQPVAIKWLKTDLADRHPDLVARFVREGAALRRLNHPNIVGILDTFEHAGRYAIVMEYVPGGSLRTLLDTAHPLPLSRVLTLGLELADALSRAHHHGIIHRDLKPENVLLAADGTPRLTDFGMARWEQDATTLTQSGTLFGSPAYMSPEAVRGEELDVRSDIWSLGVLLYELLAGRRPFEGRHITPVLASILEDPIPDLRQYRPDVPPELVDLLGRMLLKERTRRLPSMRQVAAELEAIRAGRASDGILSGQRGPEQTVRASALAVETRSHADQAAVRPLTGAGQATPGTLRDNSPQGAGEDLMFVGRERELQAILQLLAEAGGARLVTLTGPGGVGKTRLAQVIAGTASSYFADGAHVVMLAEVSEPAGIVPAIAARLGLRASDGDNTAQLLAMLRERELLLVLDNFEHLLDDVTAVAAILVATTRTRIIVTSRERLDLAGEIVYPLGGLELPAEESGTRMLDAPAAQLLLQRARLVRPIFAVEPADVAGITRICRLVQGLPLALTLAAGWAELLSFEEIADEIDRSLDFLATNQYDVPQRQRSIRAVFERSWSRLQVDEQRILAQLTIFRGGFTRQAAQDVAGASLHQLRRLVNTSWIVVSAQAQRYEIHELLRQFVAETTVGDRGVEVSHRRHAALYLDLVRSLTGNLKGPDQRQAIATLVGDADNLRAAWRYAVGHGDWEAVAGAAEGLWLFYELAGDAATGEATFAEALAALEATGNRADAGLTGFLLAAQGHFHAQSDTFAAGRALMERGVAQMKATTSRLPLALALAFLGLLARSQGDLAAAQRLGEESLGLFAEVEDHWGVALSLQLLGTALARQGRLVLAQQLLQACVETARAAGAHSTWAFAAWMLAQVLAWFGEYSNAQRLLDEAIAVGQAAGYRLSVATALAERAFLALDMGDLDSADQNFAQSIALYEATGNTVLAQATRGHTGILARLRGEGAKAEAVLLKGLAHARALEYRRDQAVLLGELALLAVDRGNRQYAAQLQTEALALWNALENEPWIAMVSGQLAATRVSLRSPAEEAEVLIRTALRLAVRHRLAPTALMTFVGLASHLAAQGERTTPLELLALVEAHPAATFDTRGRATAKMAELAAEISPSEIAAARQRGASLDWRAVAQRFAADPAVGDTRRQPALTNLNIRLPPLFGRDYELGQLAGILSGSTRRLTTLLGPGGIGKTRLSQEAGLAMLDSYADGVFFVDLASITDPAELPAAIAAPLGLRLSGSGEPRDQLLRLLSQKRLLLLLDNFEHLLEGVDLIPAILQAAPKVALLVTTRERLGLDGELVYTLGGIEIPTGEDDERAMERGAVQLLLQRVRQIRPTFDPGRRDVDALIQIARLVQGMPLAIILAASWADMLTLEVIAAEIEQSLDFLEADLRALPPRQRSVRAVFEVSWRRLPATAQICFTRMAVFRGGFSRQAAEQVAGADLHVLRSLINNSFISLDRGSRYGVHELLRQFGAERLAALGEAELPRDRHSAYYLELLRGLEPDLRRRCQAEAFQTIEDDLDNIRQAWEYAVERQKRERLSWVVDAVYLFADKRGRFREGADLLQKIRDRLAPTPADDRELWIRLTTRISLLRSLFPPEQQIPVSEVEHCRALAHQEGQVFEEALAYLAIGMYYTRAANDYEQALSRFEASLQLLRSLDDRYYLAEVLARYGICRGYAGDVTAFYQYCREGCEIARSDENPLGLLTAQGNLIESLLHLGRYTEVAQYSERQMALGEQFGARSSVAHGLQFLALARFLEGDLATARQAATRGYVLSAEIQSALAMGNSLSLQSLVASVSGDFLLGRRFAEEAHAQPLNLLGLVQVHLGDAIAQRGLGAHTDARRSLADALKFARRFATVVPTLWVLPVAALLLGDESHYTDATVLLALAHTHELSPSGWFASWRALGMLRASLEQVLEPEAFAAAWARGTEIDIPAAVAFLDLRLADDRGAVFEEQPQLPRGSG